MVKLFFAVGTVVKVFTNSTFVADTDDRRLAATIASNTSMSYDLFRS